MHRVMPPLWHVSSVDIVQVVGERCSGGQGASGGNTAGRTPLRDGGCSGPLVSSAVPMTKTPHDALFKSVFQQPENAAAELQQVLPAEHVAAIDWSMLKLEAGSCVDEALADQHSDLRDAVLGVVLAEPAAGWPNAVLPDFSCRRRPPPDRRHRPAEPCGGPPGSVDEVFES